VRVSHAVGDNAPAGHELTVRQPDQTQTMRADRTADYTGLRRKKPSPETAVETSTRDSERTGRYRHTAAVRSARHPFFTAYRAMAPGVNFSGSCQNSCTEKSTDQLTGSVIPHGCVSGMWLVTIWKPT